MPDDGDGAADSFAAPPGRRRTPGFLIPPGYPQVISIDFNTLLNHGHATPEVLEHLTGLLAALQDSFRDARLRQSVAAPGPARTVVYVGDPNDCADLYASCPDVRTTDCAADCASDRCGGYDSCPDHVPYETCMAVCTVNVCNADTCPDHIPTCLDDCSDFGTLACPTDLPIKKTSDGT